MAAHRKMFLFILTLVNNDQMSVSYTKTCPAGYIGQNCEIPCRYPAYGDDCQNHCNCPASDCNVTTGCKVGSPTVSPVLLKTTTNVRHADWASNPATGCPLGYTGNECNIPCRYPSFGAACQAVCTCTEEYCNPIRGCNVSANKVCTSENGSNHDAMLYSIVVLCLWTVIQLSVYFYLLFYFKSGSYGYFL